MSRWISKRTGISHYISILFLVAIATIGGGLLYLNLFGELETNPPITSVNKISIDSHLCNNETIKIYLRNLGDTISIENVYLDDALYYEDGYTLIINSIGKGDNYAVSGEVTEITLTPNSSLDSQLVHKVIIVFGGGGKLPIAVKRNTEKTIPVMYSKPYVYWPLDENVGEKVYDVGIGEQAGIISGAEWVPGVNLYALGFDGLYDNVFVKDSDTLDLSSVGSIEVWIKADSITAFAGIMHKGVLPSWSDEAYSLQFWRNNRMSLVLNGAGGGSLRIESTYGLVDDEWYHVVATWNSSEVCLYINGELNNHMSNSIGNVKVTSGGLVIGAQLPVDYNPSYKRLGFNGVIDEPAIYQACISQKEIKTRYGSLSPN